MLVACVKGISISKSVNKVILVIISAVLLSSILISFTNVVAEEEALSLVLTPALKQVPD